jgi:hypothetical protein
MVLTLSLRIANILLAFKIVHSILAMTDQHKTLLHPLPIWRKMPMCLNRLYRLCIDNHEYKVYSNCADIAVEVFPS